MTVETSEELGEETDALLALGLLPAMRLGASLRLPGEVSSRLLESSSRIQGIFQLWDEEAQIVRIEASRRHSEPRREGDVGIFFSGGVDSFYTLLERRDEITDLVFVEGFDIPLSGRDELRRGASEMAHDVAEALGKRLIVVRTDVRSFSDRYVPFFYYYGSALAAIALLFQRRLATVVVPAGQTYECLLRDGSHPMLDPLWSTERTELVSDGVQARRTEKVKSIASSELAMRWLRVCLENPDGAYNCGRCEKCLRTLVNLRAVGAEGRCRTLPDSTDLRRLRRLALLEERHRLFVLDSLRVVEASGDDPKLARALRTVLLRSRVRAAVRDQLRRVAPPWVRTAVRALRDRHGAQPP